MKTSRFLLVSALAALFASCASDLDTHRVPVSAGTGAAPPHSGSGLVAELEASLNDYRRSIGKDPIPRHAGLDRLAREHCKFMAEHRGEFTLGSENISHYGFEERAIYANKRYGMGNCAENVAGGQIGGDVAGQLTKAWTQSSKHLYNLKGNWHATGLGVYVAPDGYVYAVQFFASKGHSGMGFYDHMREF